MSCRTVRCRLPHQKLNVDHFRLRQLTRTAIERFASAQHLETAQLVQFLFSLDLCDLSYVSGAVASEICAVELHLVL